MNNSSVFVYGGISDDRRKKIINLINKIDKNLLKRGHPDYFEINIQKDKASIGIDEVKKIINFLITKPYSSKYKIVVIFNAHALTLQAQNALLKTLEEPPYYCSIFLETKSENSLIETLRSRCKKFEVRSEYTNNENKYNLNEIKNMTIDQKFSLAETLAKKEKGQLETMFENFISQERQHLIERHENTAVSNLELLNNISKNIAQTNINTRLALEYFLINLS